MNNTIQQTPCVSISSNFYQAIDTITGKALTEAEAFTAADRCAALEHGCILYFPTSPLSIPVDDHHFLLTQKQLESPQYKNIAYRPNEDRLTGVKAKDQVDVQRLHTILKTFSHQAGLFLQDFLAPYHGWGWDFATFRPIEERGRKMRLRARNDLIHVDSFPTRPTYGGRILRFFTNIHPYRERIWQTSETFETLSTQYWSSIPQPESFNQDHIQQNGRGLHQLLKTFGFKLNSNSPYDRWMLNLHNHLKEDMQFQATCPKYTWRFPAGSAWMVMTDMVSHSVQSGQYALEQTVIVPFHQMVCPEKSPLRLLQNLEANHS